MIYYYFVDERNNSGNEINPANIRYINEGDYDSVYSRVMTITDGNHLEAENAASWCELAVVGDYYEHDLFSIAILDL